MAAVSATTLPVSAAFATPFDATDVPLGAFVATHTDRADWRPAPITPGWVLDGRPVARYVPLARGRDDLGSTTLWDCTAGTFRWHFVWDETVHILEGAVEVGLPTGEVHRLTAGSVAFFPAGSSAIWKVEGHVRKLAVCRRAYPGPLAKALGVARAAKRTLARLRADLPGHLGEMMPAFTSLRYRLGAAAMLTTLAGLDLMLDFI